MLDITLIMLFNRLLLFPHRLVPNILSQTTIYSSSPNVLHVWLIVYLVPLELPVLHAQLDIIGFNLPIKLIQQVLHQQLLHHLVCAKAALQPISFAQHVLQLLVLLALQDTILVVEQHQHVHPVHPFYQIVELVTRLHA